MADRVRASVDFLTQRLGLIRAIYIVSVASTGPREEIHQEFYQAVADVLEGVPLSKLKLAYIDKRKIKEELTWLRERS